MNNSYLKIFRLVGEAKDDGKDISLELEVNNLTNIEAAKLLAAILIDASNKLDKAYGLEDGHMLKSMYIMCKKEFNK